MSYSICVDDAIPQGPPLRRSPETATPAVPTAGVPVIGGAEDKGGNRRKGCVVVIEANIGDVVAVVIEGNGVIGTFIGPLVAVEDEFIRVVLTAAVGPIPAGTIMTILVDDIAAIGRIPAATVTV